MTDLKDYAKQPYLLEEAELISKPMNEVCDLIKYIESMANEIYEDLKIHSENMKMIQGYFQKNISPLASQDNMN